MPIEMQASMLDQVAFLPVPLRIEADCDSLIDVDLSQEFRLADTDRIVNIGSPLFVRCGKGNWFQAEPNDDEWDAVCARLASQAILLACPVTDLDAVRPASMPLRLTTRFPDEPFDALELQTADMLEINLCKGGQWAWPPELSHVDLLPAFLSSIRQASGGGTLIGLAIPMGTRDADLQSCIDSGADFLTLVASDHTADEASIRTIATTRAMLRAQGRAHFPLLADVALRQVSDMAKWIGLGASLVRADSLFTDLLTKASLPDATRTGMLGGLAMDYQDTENSKLVGFGEQLDALIYDVRMRLAFTGARRLAEFGQENLRATTADAARIAGLELL